MEEILMSIKNFYKSYLMISNPHKYQEFTWECIKRLNFPLFIKAPTGSGKTEAVLAPFLSQFIDNNFTIAPRMIYVLPMRVLVNSLADRVRQYTRRINPHISVEVQHGDVPNSPFFMADIIFTTLDQFVYGFARASGQVGRHIDIPAGAIASSLVVFDEAHMYRDEFTFSIMRAVMEILYKSNIPFVVMTATMPETLERSLFENINMPEDCKISASIPASNTLDFYLEKGPLYSDDEVNIPEVILDKIREKKTLIVVNQVKRAQKIYEDIKLRLNLNDKQIVLLHSRFTKADRKDHEEQAISLIPRKKDGKIVIPEGVGIVVSTQVLEAGIDFSAEFLLTELAPADSLVQRAGRCARYEGERGEMVIFPVDGKDRNHLPYKKEHLEKTLEWLKRNEQFNIKNFNEVCSFVNETLDYQANDYEARDTLIDLYECVLYADSKPDNIQVRKSKPVRILVVDFSLGIENKKYRKKQKDEIEEIVENSIKKTNIHENTFDTDIGVAWSLYNKKLLKWELKWELDKEKKKNWKLIFIKKDNPDEEDIKISPFKTYILNAESNYTSEKGIINDDSFII